MQGNTLIHLKGEIAKAAHTAAVLTATLLISAAAVVALPGVPVPKAFAGDLDYQGQDAGSKFVRIGLNKSIVIKLPAEARDVLVGNPDVVDAVVRTRNVAYLFARAVGQTNIFFFDADGQQILALDLEVTHDMAALQKLINRTIPGTKIKVDTIGDNVVLGGVAKTPAEAKMAMDLAVKYAGNDEKKVMSTIAVTGKEQVMLKVRVVELRRNIAKQLGVDLTASFSVFGVPVKLANINPFTSNPTNLISPQAGYGVFDQTGGTRVDGVLRAMEDNGLIRTLAEPTLTAISGESAKFLAGGEFPVPVQGTRENGQQGFQIEFKPFGIGLGFTPVVMSEGRIVLKVNTEVSELTGEGAIETGGVRIPALSVRRVETTVELPSGGSLAMAGLIKDQTRQSIAGVPGLQKLPVLGALFRSRDFMKNETELVVIVTPYIVNAVNEKQLATPLDGINNASDSQAILFGKLNKVYGSGDKPDGTYNGNVGFIIK